MRSGICALAKTEIRIPKSETSPRAAALRPEDLERLRAKLEKLFKEGAYRDAALSLQSLADKAGTTRHKMSAAIRELYGCSFYQLMASRRVAEAARLLQSKQAAHRTVADIAFSVGFNTLSAFNAAFKAEFGSTPSQFRGKNVGSTPRAAEAKAL